jgi:triacylglycerol lipase
MPTFPFDPARRADSVCNAYCMAAAARAAYFDAPKLEAEVLESWQLSEYHAFSSASIQGYIANGNGFTILAFRGSDHLEIDDWVGNADFDLVYDPHVRGGQVHSGFQRSAASIWPQIKNLVAEYRPAGHKLFLTGHSLGGALAMLTAARFASQQRAAEIDGIFTFGQPRAGDRDFARRFDRDFKDRAFRFVNRYDLITRLPPRLLGYDHAGQLRYLDENGVLHENISLWQHLLTTLNPFGKDAQDYIGELRDKLPGALADHNGGRYIELLGDLCPATR